MEQTQKETLAADNLSLEENSPINADTSINSPEYDEKFTESYRKNLSKQFLESSRSSKIRIFSFSLIIISMVVLMFFIAKGGFFDQLSKEKPDDDTETAFSDMKEYYKIYDALTKSEQAYLEMQNSYKSLSALVNNCIADNNAKAPNTTQDKFLKDHLILCWRKIQQSTIRFSPNSTQRTVQISTGDENIEGVKRKYYNYYFPKYNFESGNVITYDSVNFPRIYPDKQIIDEAFMSLISYVDTQSIVSIMASIKIESDEMLEVSRNKQKELNAEKERTKKVVTSRFSQMSNNIITFSSSISYRLIAIFSVFAVSVFALRWITNELKFTISQHKAFFILMAMPKPINSIDQMKSVISLTGESVPEPDTSDLFGRLLDLASQALPKKS